MSSLILLRHGQASFGAERYDELSGRGRAQAEAVGRHLAARGRRFTQVWIGPRERHRMTARHALEPLGQDWQVPAEPALDEFAEGQQILAAAERRRGVKLRGEGAIVGRESVRFYVDEIEAWAERRAHIAGVPDPATFRATVAGWLARATAQTDAGQNLLAVTSGGVIAAVMAIVLDLPDARIAYFMRSVGNASLSEFAFSPGRGVSLVSYNVSAHLPDELLTRL